MKPFGIFGLMVLLSWNAPASAQTEMLQTTKPAWTITATTSDIDDSTNIVISMASNFEIEDQFGRPTRPWAIAQCSEGQTMFWLDFGGLFMADIQGWGTVTTRIDKEKARKIQMNRSTDYRALGLSAGKAIPFLKSLVGKKRLLIAAIPFNGAEVRAVFELDGFDQALERVKAACHWK